MRAAFFHVIGDAAVSVIVIAGLLLARSFGWLWLDPVAGIIGSAVIASWSYVLLRDTAAVLLDRTADRGIMRDLRHAVEAEGDRLNDLHLWRLGPGHLAAIVSVTTRSDRGALFYHALLRRFRRFRISPSKSADRIDARAFLGHTPSYAICHEQWPTGHS